MARPVDHFRASDITFWGVFALVAWAIAMLSANAMDHHRAEALAAGADLHIAKPVSAAALIGGIQEALSAIPPGR